MRATSSKGEKGCILTWLQVVKASSITAALSLFSKEPNAIHEKGIKVILILTPYQYWILNEKTFVQTIVIDMLNPTHGEMYTVWKIWPYACSLLWEIAWLLFSVIRLFYVTASILFLSFLLFSPSGWFTIPSFITSFCIEDFPLMFSVGKSEGDKFF